MTYRELARRIRDSLLDGRLSAHTRLPSERALADALHLSRTTVAAAYALLRDEDWLVSRRGSGSVLRPAPGRTSAPLSPLSWGATAEDAVINLTTASLPAPAEQIQAAVDAAAADLSAYFRQDGYEPLGIRSLRESIARRYTASGLPTTAEEILVTNGGQHAWTIVLAELSGPGDRVLFDCPTYPLALEAARSSPADPGAGRGTAVGPAALGPGPDDRGDGAVHAAAGLPDPRLPQPDRCGDGRRRPGPIW